MVADHSTTVQGGQAVANRSDLDQLGQTILARQSGENGFAKHRVHRAHPYKRGINPPARPPVPARSVRSQAFVTQAAATADEFESAVNTLQAELNETRVQGRRLFGDVP